MKRQQKAIKPVLKIEMINTARAEKEVMSFSY